MKTFNVPPPQKHYHSLPGNLKISPEVWDSLSQSELQNIVTTILLYYKKYNTAFKENNHTRVILSKTRVLHIDHKNEKTNFYILDSTQEKRTQYLNKTDIEKIEWKEKEAFAALEAYVAEDKNLPEHQKNMLEQSLLHTAYKEFRSGHSPPKFLGADFDEDFELTT